MDTSNKWTTGSVRGASEKPGANMDKIRKKLIVPFVRTLTANRSALTNCRVTRLALR